MAAPQVPALPPIPRHLCARARVPCRPVSANSASAGLTPGRNVADPPAYRRGFMGLTPPLPKTFCRFSVDAPLRRCAYVRGRAVHQHSALPRLLPRLYDGVRLGEAGAAGAKVPPGLSWPAAPAHPPGIPEHRLSSLTACSGFCSLPRPAAKVWYLRSSMSFTMLFRRNEYVRMSFLGSPSELKAPGNESRSVSRRPAGSALWQRSVSSLCPTWRLMPAQAAHVHPRAPPEQARERRGGLRSWPGAATKTGVAAPHEAR